MICLNAMRIGLLTRFMGVLGIICGALIVLPLLSPLPIVQTFWLGALAALLAWRWPNGVPPAWTTGEAVPWPSQAKVRESRRAQMGAEQAEPEDRGAPAAPRSDAAASRGLQEEEAQAALLTSTDSELPGRGYAQPGWPSRRLAPAHLREEGALHADGRR